MLTLGYTLEEHCGLSYDLNIKAHQTHRECIILKIQNRDGSVCNTSFSGRSDARTGAFQQQVKGPVC